MNPIPAIVVVVLVLGAVVLSIARVDRETWLTAMALVIIGATVLALLALAREGR